MTHLRLKIIAALVGALMLTAVNGRSQPATLAAAGPHKLKVFLFAGQSNMEGKGDGSKMTEEDHRRLAAAQKHVQLAYNHEPASPLHLRSSTPGMRKKFGVGETVFGPEMFFGLRLAEAWPDEQILLIKRSVGATSLAGRWNPEWTLDKAIRMLEGNAPPLYPDFIAYVREILSLYPKDSYEICGMVWVQGESDGDSRRWAGAAAEYGANLMKLIAAVRRDTGVPDLPLIVVEVGNAKVIAGMTKAAAALPNVSLVPRSRDTSSPNYFPQYPAGHYNYEGQQRIGNLCAEAFLQGYGGKVGAAETAPARTAGAVEGSQR